MPDGSRKRRFSDNNARRQWYAMSRARRFAVRLGFASSNPERLTKPVMNSVSTTQSV